MLYEWAMKMASRNEFHPLLLQIRKLFDKADLGAVNDHLRHENRILRGKLGNRVPLTDADRRILVKHGLRIKDRLEAQLTRGRSVLPAHSRYPGPSGTG